MKIKILNKNNLNGITSVEVLCGMMVSITLIMFGILGGITTERLDFQREANKHGYGEYSPSNGEWRWKFEKSTAEPSITQYNSNWKYSPLKEQAIRLGFADYNTQTGQWEWLNSTTNK